MLQYKAWAVTLILLLANTLTEVDAKAISKRHVRNDWMVIPDAVAFYVFDAVNKVSPKTAESLYGAFQNPIILETRNFLIKTTTEINRAFQQLLENINGLWTKEEAEPAQH
ncbi:apovitellenin-1-like isoform X1 [Podarcis lilfordi]|uniref:Apovitellenin-1 n=1 Tax=Podarcis lilfordi TaxID=74358 RepID=A0AA35K8V7_9SAUR|nr:apovitellenin-1-like isoform X1 [Podarcis lilfordi]